jgi:hypothetical protein
MTNIPPISDGQPVTYEFLNLVVAAVNKLAKSETEGGGQQDIEISSGSGYSLSKASDVSIVIGQFNLKFGSIAKAKQSTATATVKFSGQFKSAPLIFVSAVDPSSDSAADVSYISLTTTQVSATQFTCRGRRMVAGKDAADKDNLKINFIAIGPAS